MKKHQIDAALLAEAGGPLARRSIMNLLPPPANAPTEGWYRIDRKNTPDDEADVYIFSDIGYWGVEASDFARDLKDIDAETINVFLNSPGGSVFDGLAIYSALIKHGAKIIVHIEGWAASIASVIAMAGDEIRINESAQVMIHKPWSYVVGDDDAMIKEASVLKSIEDSIVDVYVARTDGDREEISAWVKAETWFKGQEAVDAGFADVLIENKKKEKAKAATNLQAGFFAAIFPHMPADVRASIDAVPPKTKSNRAAAVKTERDFEDFLNEHGFSSSRARAIASVGFKAKPERRDDAGNEPLPPTPERRDDAAVVQASQVAAIQLAALTFPKSL